MSTADRDRLSCDKCRRDFSPGRHIVEPDDPAVQPYYVECPNKAATRQAEKVREVAKLAQSNAWAAAQDVMRDVADTYPQFHANLIRDRFDQAGIPTALRGSAFTWAAAQGLIEKVAGEGVQSTEATTRHDIKVWRSLVHRRAS